MDISEKVLAAFSAEHKEFLEGIRSLLGELETAAGSLPGYPLGAADDPRIDEMYRMAHSLKGGARVCDLRPIETLGHRLEAAFERIRNGELTLDNDVSGQIHLILDAIEDHMAAVMSASGRRETPGTHPEANVSGSPRPPTLHPSKEECLSPAAPLSKGETRGMRVGAGLSESGSNPVRTQPAIVEAHAMPIESVRVSTEALDRLLRSTGQWMTATKSQNRIARQLAEVTALAEELDRERQSLRKLASSELHAIGADSGCFRLTRYFELADRSVCELSRKTQQIARLHQRSCQALESVGREVQQDVRHVRMVPVESVFQGFRKMVRDLAREVGKETQVHLTGMDVRADRMVLQALKDPVMHILRNAVCHGIESPAERRAAGKPVTGRIDLIVEADARRLKVVIADDGRGIDPKEIAQTALRRGLITEAEAAEKSEEELARLILQPGFSTSSSVTELSGRGMGLSVVHRAVSRLQGDVLLRRVGPTDHVDEDAEDSGDFPKSPESLPVPVGARQCPPGAVIELSVPLSTRTGRLLVVESAGQRFAVPLSRIRLLVRSRREDLQTVEGRPVLRFQGIPIPLVALHAVLGIHRDAAADVPETMRIAVLQSGTAGLAVAVDAFVAETDALIHDLNGPAAQLACFSGAILQDDGSAVLVLAVEQLSSGQWAREGWDTAWTRGKPVRPRTSLRPVPASGSPRRPADGWSVGSAGADREPHASRPPLPRDMNHRVQTVLIVDDSFTTRTLEKSILEAHGYDVRIAVDGLEALSQLRADPVDLVISDIEMPRMDGFALLEAMKQEEAFARIPVILVTSRSRQEDRRRGLALGADAYIVKQKFDHEELMETIRQIACTRPSCRPGNRKSSDPVLRDEG